MSKEELDNVKSEITKINKNIDMVECQYSKVDPKQLIGIKAFDLKRCLEIDHHFLEDEDHHSHDSHVSSIGFKFSDCDLSLGQLQEWIKKLIIDQGNNLYRYKGVISVKGMDQRFVFQGVQQESQFIPDIMQIYLEWKYEPVKIQDPKSCVSTNSTTLAENLL